MDQELTNTGDSYHHARVNEVVDKLTYNSVILTYKGHSYRLKENCSRSVLCYWSREGD